MNVKKEILSLICVLLLDQCLKTIIFKKCISRQHRSTNYCKCTQIIILSFVFCTPFLQSRKKHRRSRSADTILTAKLTVAPGGSAMDIDSSPTSTRSHHHRRSRSGDRRTMRKCNSATTPTGGKRLLKVNFKFDFFKNLLFV